MTGIIPSDPYRGRITFVAKVKKPRTLRGRLRSLRRRWSVWWGGKWRTRFERCSVCKQRHNASGSYLPSFAVFCCRKEKWELMAIQDDTLKWKELVRQEQDLLWAERQAHNRAWQLLRELHERFKL